MGIQRMGFALTSEPAMKRRTAFVVALLLALAGCVAPLASLGDDTRRLWDQTKPPSETVAAPDGFTVTPAQAYAVVTGGRPQKFAWYIYADSTSYYLVEHAPLLAPTSGYARKYGVQIDGRSGACLKRCPSAAH